MKIRRLLVMLYMRGINCMFGRDNKMVVFRSFCGNQYSDSPKYISEELHRKKKDCKIIWIFNDIEKKKRSVPTYVKCIKNKSLATLFFMARAKVWVDNFEMPTYMYKKKDQYYIQTYHGDRGFKKILYSAREDLPGGRYGGGKLLEEIYCDLALAGSDFGCQKYIMSFDYTGEILQVGLPRNDILLHHSVSKVNMIKEKVVEDIKDRIVLYAPTFRDRETELSNQLDIERVVHVLEKKTGYRWKCLVRAHVGSGIQNLKSECCIDVTEYEDMSELLLISDMLITDYSACAGDYVLLGRPVILYHYDVNRFVEENRKLRFKIEESPYYVAHNMDELCNIVLDLDEEKVKENCKEILEFYGTTETGTATSSVVEKIVEKLK